MVRLLAAGILIPLFLAHPAIGQDKQGQTIITFGPLAESPQQKKARIRPAAAAIPSYRQYRFPLDAAVSDQARADFDEDGCADIVLLHTQAGKVLVFLSKRNNPFSNPLLITTPEVGYYIAGIDDYDGDGKTDILLSSNAAKSHFQLIPGKGKGTFGKIKRFGKKLKDERLGPVRTTDINHDGKPDVVGLISISYQMKTALIAVNKGKGKFDLKRITLPLDYDGLAAGDFTGDGFGDFLLVDNYTKKLVVYRSLGNGSFKAAQDIGVSGIQYDAYPVDIDGDGALDLIGSNYTSWFRLGRGTGTFLPERSLPGSSSYGSGADLTDVNRDGLPDIVAPASGGGLNIHTGAKGPNFNTAVNLGSYLYFTPSSVNSISCCDFDADKKPELIATNRFSGVTSSAASTYNLVVFEPDQAPARLTISGMTFSKKYFSLMFVYLTGQLDYEGENIEMRYVPDGTDPAQSAFLTMRIYVDFPWPFSDLSGTVRATGDFLNRPGEQGGTISFNLVVPTSVLIIGTLTPSVSVRDVYLYDYHLVRSNELDP